jgi:hypothetical protein
MEKKRVMVEHAGPIHGLASWEKIDLVASLQPSQKKLTNQ